MRNGTRRTFRLFGIVIPCALALAGEAKERTALDEAKEARQAVSCLTRVADGEKLPPSPEPKKGSTEALIRILVEGGQGDHSASSEQRDALARCLPPSAYFRLYLDRSSARLLAGCFEHAAARLEGAKGTRAMTAARYTRDSCVHLAHRLGTTEQNLSSIYNVEITPIGPGLSVSPLGPPDTVNMGALRIIASVDAVSDALGRCRDAHGTGTVWAALRTGKGEHFAHTFPSTHAGQVPEQLAACVTRALDGLPPAQKDPWWAVFTVRLAARPRVVDEGDPLLAGKLEPARDPRGALGGLGPVVPQEARKRKLGGRVVLLIQVDGHGRAFVLETKERPNTLGEAFERSCRAEVGSLRFEPPRTRDNKPVEVRTEHVCNFVPEQYRPLPMPAAKGPI